MIQLGPISYEDIAPWIADFQKRSNNCENVPPNAELVGIFYDSTLAGYFIVTAYADKDLEINHGYLHSPFRHLNLSKLAMSLLQEKAKASGFKRIVLASSRTLKAYTKFMANMGFQPERIIYSKEV